MKPSLVLSGSLFAMTLLLSACGGSDDATVAPTPVPKPTPAPTPVSGFTKTATWDVAFEAKAGGELCFDIDTQKAADCTSDTWDVKAKDDGRSTSFFTNSGTSGAGKGGAVASPLDAKWADLKKWLNGMADPISGALDANSYIKDFAEGVFTGTNPIKSAAFEYDLAGDHKLSPNFKVFLISEDTTNPVAKQFALQVTGYYGGTGGAVSGFPSIRWVDRTSNNELSATLDASKGWVYFDLAKNAVSTETGAWHIAFNRNNMKLNSSVAGKPLGGLLAKTPDGFYTAEGKAIAAKFADTNNLAQTRALLTATDLLPAKPKWLSDKNASPLSPAAKGNYPVLDYGWYTYYGSDAEATKAGLAAAHMLKANPDAATMIRSAEGNSFARMHLKEVQYADPKNASSKKTLKFEFDIQPKS
ncbi:HmuY family protein [Iodobacter arcticus]|uniref:HmuY family protein n=1 Tax=Iodobacter arcticus TaxID=590593 RepID=A0ABW2R607_9NEIS